MPATNATQFFDLFPKIKYDVNRGNFPVHETVTDIFFRIGMIRDTLSQTSSYYVYEIQDGETPEILADKFYDDAGAGWMILYANYIIDPQWEWPLDYAQFQNYIIGKYGSIENAKTKVHHYEKVITRTNSKDNTTTVTRFEIDKERIATGPFDVPYNYYEPSTEGYDWREGAVPVSNNSRQASFVNDTTVTENINRNIVYAYDYEDDLNEKKREIKVIQKIYYNQIFSEFTVLALNTRTDILEVAAAAASTGSYIRRLV